MSSVEPRNELKNYLELASLAGNQPLNEKTISKGVTIYKRANPMMANESAVVEAINEWIWGCSN